jgi:pimeloyl-ACP methyl ester carboxylesterase
VLVICGREDRIVDTHVVQDAIAPLANYQCVTISHCGHAPQLEQPEVVNKLILSFLRGTGSLDMDDRVDTTFDAGLAVN